jgi:hypothetical protein
VGGPDACPSLRPSTTRTSRLSISCNVMELCSGFLRTYKRTCFIIRFFPRTADCAINGNGRLGVETGGEWPFFDWVGRLTFPQDPDYNTLYFNLLNGGPLERLFPAGDAAVLNNFRCVPQAEYRHGDRNGCLKGTFWMKFSSWHTISTGPLFIC